MSTYTLKENSLKQDRLYIYGSSRLGELVADAKNQDVCSISISEDELLNSREQAIDGLIRNLFSNLQDPAFTEQIVSYWNVKWNDYFSQTVTMHPNTNNIQTHQFNWNAWVEWMCKMKCYENLNSEVFGIWENHWNGRLQSFYNGTITCGYAECPETYTELLTEWTVNLNNEVIPQMQAHNFVSSCSVQNKVYVKGSRRYELSNHLGNVLAVVSDRKIESDEDYFYAGLGSGYKFENGTYIADLDGEYSQNSGPDGIISSYSAEVISANDYYAFGSLMPGRGFSGGEYKYGFNGKEKDNETYGERNAYDFGARIYDPRLGRWLSLDPLAWQFAGLSPYHFALNSPIWMIDPDGMKPSPTTTPFPIGTDKRIKDYMGFNSITRFISTLIPSEDISFGEDCITLVNSIIQKVLFDANQKVGDRMVGKGSTHEALFAAGKATGLKVFNFVDAQGGAIAGKTKADGKSKLGNSAADHLGESVGNYLKDNYDMKTGGVKVYGLSMMNGYHSMLITVNTNEEGKLVYTLYDQGPGTSIWTGTSTFSSPEELDAQINDYVKSRQGKRTDNGSDYPATVEIFLIKNDPPPSTDSKSTKSKKKS